MNLRHLGDRVVIRAATKEEKTASGIIIPDTAGQERPEQGEIIAVGPGRYDDGKLVPMSVKIGDKVVFKKYAPDEVKVSDEEYLVLSESDIMAVVE